jgi:hypothetical protein
VFVISTPSICAECPGESVGAIPLILGIGGYFGLGTSTKKFGDGNTSIKIYVRMARGFSRSMLGHFGRPYRIRIPVRSR